MGISDLKQQDDPQTGVLSQARKQAGSVSTNSNSSQASQPRGIPIGGSSVGNPEADDETRFSEQLRRMEEMGLTNRELNLQMLRYTKGDSNQAAQIIIDMNKK
jgi:hypothetical protein